MLTKEAAKFKYEFGVGEGAPSFPPENSTLGGLSDDETSWELRKSKLGTGASTAWCLPSLLWLQM